MNRPDDFDDLELQRRLDALLAHEPPMASLPGDDLQRGQRLVRRRRWGAVGTAAVLVPAMAVGAVAATNSLFAGGPTTAGKLAPAGGGDASDAACANPPALVKPGGGTVRLTEDPAVTEPDPAHDPSRNQGSTRAQESGTGDAGEYLVCSDSSNGWGCDVTGGSSGGDDPVSSDDQNGTGGDPTSCAPYTVDSTSTDRMDELDQLLGDTLDPSGDHTGGSSFGGISQRGVSPGSDEGDEGDVSAVSVGRTWDADGRQGAVSLSVFKSEDEYVPEGCGDTSFGGPEVSCERTTLPDGTKVDVGHGKQDGAERLTVAYYRPNGNIVVATADEATSEWFVEGTGPDPLTDLPVTVDQLAQLATAPGAHF